MVDVFSGRRLATMAPGGAAGGGHSGKVNAVAWSWDSSRLATGGCRRGGGVGGGCVGGGCFGVVFLLLAMLITKYARYAYLYSWRVCVCVCV